MRHNTPGKPAEKRTFRAHVRNASSLAGIIGPIVLTAVTLFADGMHADFNWIRQTASQLGNGPYGWVENIGFIIFGILMIVFAKAVYSGFQIKKSLIASITAWVLIGIGFILLGIFQANTAGQISVHGDIHNIVARTVGILFPLTCFLMVPSFEIDPHWDKMTLYTIVSGVAFFIVILLRFMLPERWFSSWSGLFERALMFNAMVWLEIVAVKLLPHPRDLG